MKDRFLSVLSRCYAIVNQAPRLLVITFHRVGGDSLIGGELIHFYLTYLMTHYHVVSPSQLSFGGIRRPVAIITVDDCHRDVYEYIYPVALELNVPITLCVPTDFFFRGRWLWFDKLFWMVDGIPRGSEIDVNGVKVSVGERSSMLRLTRYLKSKAPAERDAILGELAKALERVLPDKPTEKYRAVTIEEMREMLDSGLVELCAHTVTHPILSMSSDEDLHRELAQSKRELEEFCNGAVASFCYPNGRIGDFNERTTQVVKEVGYRMAFTSVPGINMPETFEPYGIKRIHVHPRSSVFAKDASGLGDVQRGLVRMLGLYMV